VLVGVAYAVAQPVHDVDAHREKRRQLDERLERDGQHHPMMALGADEVARAEQNRECGQQQCDGQRAVDEVWSVGSRSDENLESERNSLELQRDVGQDANDCDRGDQHRYRLMTAISRADEVGDRRDVVALGDPNDSLEERSAEQEHQHRPEVDRQEIPAAARCASYRSVERPRCAVHAQRETIDPGFRSGDPTMRARRSPRYAIAKRMAT
jgi:hypothetical protein